MNIQFENSYSTLPNHFYKKTSPLNFPKAHLIEFNNKLAKELNLNINDHSEKSLISLFTGHLNNSSQDPIALAYAGHQFGHFNPQLGDGRACLLGEVIGKNKQRYDIALKGSGPTIYSRNGDGKSAIGPVIREYIISEAMASLGVPTTRALCAIRTNESVYREEELPGAVLTRVAKSHIRIGTFEYIAAHFDTNSLKELADYSIKRHYPHLLDNEDKNIYLEFIKQVSFSQAFMIAKWLSLGFIHGVMNTDNMTITGETIDYGPCAFMDEYKANKVFSSIDRNGRYAYNKQIEIGKWNLYKFASTLLPLIDSDIDEAINIVKASIESYLHNYEDQWLAQMSKKIGIVKTKPSDIELINNFLELLEKNQLDFTNSFRSLSEESSPLRSNQSFSDFFKRLDLRHFEAELTKEQVIDLMNKSNPVYIPRNHLVQKAIEKSTVADDDEFKKLNLVLNKPFIYNDEYQQYTLQPKENERVFKTFCGT